MLKEGMTLIEQLQDRAAILQENGYQYEPLEDAVQLIQNMSEDIVAMGADLQYLNALCLSLMSLLPETVTSEDIRKAMKYRGAEIREAMAKQGSHVREEKRIITDV